ncbi:MAG: extracellular solute-binding protein [Deltaproteobacteria bacterium]|nr:extracellular solute-binding protein [Deltaproteobacteria bacterium]
MVITVPKKIVASFTLLFLMLATMQAVAASPILLKAKKEAEAKGYIFFTAHDEIVAMAKKEGKLKVGSDLEPTNFKPLIDAFKQKYPFFTDVHIEEVQDISAHQRLLLEIKSGQAKGWDIVYIIIDLAKEYRPYIVKHDILGMARHGVLEIDPRMIHPVDRNMVSVTSSIRVVPYNRKLISEDKVPAKWEDFLKPEFKGKKFVLDLRPIQVASLVPAWGLERTLEFARKLAGQQPVWGRGATRMITAVATGEYSMYLGSNFSAANRAMAKDRTGNLNYKVIEPVPSLNATFADGILNTAANPHAALLWLEFFASPEGQEILDKYGPFRGSVFTPGSVAAKVTHGKQLSLVDWDHFTKFQEYEAKIVAAYGFPKADR